MKNTHKLTLGLTAIIALAGSFFLGFYTCGGYAHVKLYVGLGVLVALLFSFLSIWKLIAKKNVEQQSRARQVFTMFGFCAVLLISLIFINAIGWVVYYSPTSFANAYIEFKNALIGGRCG